MAEAMYTASEHGTNLTTYKTVHNKQHDYFVNTFFPKNDLYHLPPMEKRRTLRHKNTTARTIYGPLRDPCECICMILSSAWAHMDIQLYNIYGEVITGDHHTNTSFFSI